ncbi:MULTISPECIES: VUT family protein [Actinosynnema]|uniref:VUT family protein n=1 Tax=Actinosynnema TaxID=40566 RepID=UPI0020A49251|nr:VUT family protein [Actinosynnema pretiosum]MCP2094711.1 hypothetical protein [Actinosynnema pretiosum]
MTARTSPPPAAGLLLTAGLFAYLLLVLVTNLAWKHLPPLDVVGVPVPAGALFAALCLTARDLLHDHLGTRGALPGVAVGAGMSALLASPRIALASAAAFTVSELLDTLVYARLRNLTRLGAVAASNSVGLLVDTLVFLPLALGDSTMATGQLIGKTTATVLALAALHAWRTTRWSRS